MSWYLAAILTFGVMLAAKLFGWALSLPSRLYTWLGDRFLSASSPWLERVLDHLTMPLLWVLLFCTIWLLLVVAFGRPAAVLTAAGSADTTTRRTGRQAEGGRMRQGGFWAKWHEWVCLRHGPCSSRPDAAIVALASLAEVLCVAAYVVSLFRIGESLFLMNDASIPLVGALLVIGMLRAMRSAEDIVSTVSAKNGRQGTMVGEAVEQTSQALSELTSQPALGLKQKEDTNGSC